MRISDDPEGRAVGVERQEQDARALAERQRWVIAEPIYRDNDVWATRSRRRPEWERLLADIEAGSIDAVVAYSSSRLYRRPRDLQRLIDLASKRDLRLPYFVRPTGAGGPGGARDLRDRPGGRRRQAEHLRDRWWRGYGALREPIPRSRHARECERDRESCGFSGWVRAVRETATGVATGSSTLLPACPRTVRASGEQTRGAASGSGLGSRSRGAPPY